MPTRAADHQKLDFHEKLIQSGKGGGTDALLKRLKTLHVKLKELDQDAVDLKTVNKVTKELIDSVILHHKDRGVKAYAACCLADILRIYAPDAPYNADQLRDIFQFFIVQVAHHLKLSPSTTRPLAPSKRGNDSQSQSTLTSNARITEIPYYTEYNYLIDSLANIKSVVLIVDVPGADDLITTYFESFVECVRSDMNKQLWRNIVNMLAEVLQETDTVPPGVMDCIFQQLETYASKPETPAFQLIVEVCNGCPQKLQRPTLSHFQDIQHEHGVDPSPTDLKALKESHELLLIIFRHCHSLLLNVIPVLEENLCAADEMPLRQLTTETLGKMFGERPVTANGLFDFARSYPSAWKAWLGRRVDKAIQVRLAWIEATGPILVNHPELRRSIESCLQDRIQDSDDRARAAICEVIGSLDYETALHHVGEPLLRLIGNRMSDKKANVRAEAVTALAKLWSLAQAEIEANDPTANAKFGWIPQEMLNAHHRAIGAEAKTQISLAFRTHILPLPARSDDEQAWVDRFLLVAAGLDEAGIKMLDKMTGVYGFAKGSSPYRAFIDLCEKNNGGVMEENEHAIKNGLTFVIDAIARALFGDHEKARKDMQQFAALNEARLYKLFKELFDPQCDLRTTQKCRNELLRRIEQSHTSILETFTVIIDSGAWLIINQSSIPGLIKRVQSPEGSRPERTAEVAAHYLAFLAKHCAPMYKSHTSQLAIIIKDKKDNSLVEVGIQALAAVCAWDKSCAPPQKAVVARAEALALTGTPRQAKFASRFILHCRDDKAASRLISTLSESLADASDEELLPLLSSASELAVSAPLRFKDHAEEICSFIVNDLMNRRSPSAEVVDESYVPLDELEPLDHAKVIAMRVLTHRCLGFAKNPEVTELGQPTLTFLVSIVVNNGRVNDDTLEGAQAQIHMRLRATLCLIKLAHVRAFDRALTPYFVEMALMMQDPNFNVRQRLLDKLLTVLRDQRLLPRWNILPAIVAVDPEPENIAAAQTIMIMIVRSAAKLSAEDRINRVEMPLARLLYLLAMHPSLDWSKADCPHESSRFIELFVDNIAHRDNVSLLYTIASKLKTVTVTDEKITDEKLALFTQKKRENDDMDTESPSINLWKLSELTQMIIRARATHHSWPLSTYPGKIRLPSDIFHNLPSPQYMRAVTSRTFLPDDAEWVKSVGKKGHGTPVRRRMAAEGRSPRERKRKPAGEGQRPRKKRRSSRAARSVTESEEEDDSESDEDEHDEDEDGDESGEAATSSDESAQEVVLGRGGRRSAKTKAQKAVKKKRKSTTKRVSPAKEKTPEASSPLTDADLYD